MTSPLLVEVRGNVQIMTLNRPEARNAATLEMSEAMVAALDALDADPALSVGIITATAWSVVTVLTPGRQRPDPHGFWNAIIQSDPIYLEVAMGVTVFVLAGRYFEASARATPRAA